MAIAKKKRLKAGVYGITGCAGCQLTILFAKDRISSIINLADFLTFPFIKEKNKFRGKLDVAFLEGLVASTEDINTVREVRARTKVLIALGSCSCFGGVPAMKHFIREDIKHKVYAKVKQLNSVEAAPIDKYVKVDYYLPGCPPDENEIVSVLKDLAQGLPPRIVKTPVCVECTKNGFPCLLEEGKPCLGPITRGGCNAACPKVGHECTGCRGPHADANIKAYINLLRRMGWDDEFIERKIRTYAAFAIDAMEQRAGIKYRSDEM